MEKVTIKLGIMAATSSSRKPRVRNMADDTRFISNALQISPKRSEGLVKAMWEKSQYTTGYIEVDVTYCQLGRLIALRTAEQLVYYFKYPQVIAHEACTPEPKQLDLPIELRPGKRTIP